MKKKHKDLQPWLDYFAMLRRHEREGFLQMKAGDHEAYVTQPSLHAMTPGDDPTQQALSGALGETCVHLLNYAAYLSQQGIGYTKQPFAVNVVQAQAPYDPLYTIVISRQTNPLRRWFATGPTKGYAFEIVPYDDKPEEP
jgi:hypothetical protein